LIKRSTVTAPLLDALKDRDTRDAVRSVLERLTGGKKAPGSDAAPAAATESPAK
jgi:AsmA protein